MDLFSNRALAVFIALFLAHATFATATPAAHAQHASSAHVRHGVLEHDIDANAAIERAERLRLLDAELRSIDGQSAGATALYVTSVLSGLLGRAAVFGGAIDSISFFGNRSTSPWLIAGVALSVLSVISLGAAIGLDVDSGVRRDAWQRRARPPRREMRMGLHPVPDGATLSLSGSF